MDLRGLAVAVISLVSCLVFNSNSFVYGNLVFKVEHKFKGLERSLSALKEHDIRRHGRFLYALDLPLGGSGVPTQTGLYYTKLALGSPSRNFYVQVDTGSDILWVNCAGCIKCPTKSTIGMKLSLYDPKKSLTADFVNCDQDFCTSTYNGPLPGCRPGMQCQYNVLYGDGSSTAGYFVKDLVQIDRVTGNFQTASMNGSMIFGCGAKQSAGVGSSSDETAVDGIVGFGQANSSIISQLAASGKVKKMFSHCLDSVKGGGIFAIGQVVEPKMSTTPLIPNQAHYNVKMTAVEVGGEVLNLPTYTFDSGDSKGAIVDSGTTLAYFPDEIYTPLMSKIFSGQPSLQFSTHQRDFTCFQYRGNVDDGFPLIKLHFAGSVSLTVYPHDYLFVAGDDVWCMGIQNSGMKAKDGKDLILLGDLVLSNRLVYYDLVNQTIGWTEYNCSSSIKVKDETGAEYLVGSHVLSSASTLVAGRFLVLLLTLLAMVHKTLI